MQRPNGCVCLSAASRGSGAGTELFVGGLVVALSTSASRRSLAIFSSFSLAATATAAAAETQSRAGQSGNSGRRSFTVTSAHPSCAVVVLFDLRH